MSGAPGPDRGRAFPTTAPVPARAPAGAVLGSSAAGGRSRPPLACRSLPNNSGNTLMEPVGSRPKLKRKTRGAHNPQRNAPAVATTSARGTLNLRNRTHT
jgi:hypothetical protein